MIMITIIYPLISHIHLYPHIVDGQKPTHIDQNQNDKSTGVIKHVPNGVQLRTMVTNHFLIMGYSPVRYGLWTTYQMATGQVSG